MNWLYKVVVLIIFIVFSVFVGESYKTKKERSIRVRKAIEEIREIYKDEPRVIVTPIMERVVTYEVEDTN